MCILKGDIMDKLEPAKCWQCKRRINGLLARPGAVILCGECSRIFKTENPAKVIDQEPNLIK